MTLLKHAKSKEDIRSISQLFCAIYATAEEISTAGQMLFVLMYGDKDENLNELKYHRYMSAVASSNLWCSTREVTTDRMCGEVPCTASTFTGVAMGTSCYGHHS